MLIDPANSHDQSFYLGTFEPELRQYLKRVVLPGHTCLDIGAQKGYFTLIMSRLAGSSGRVYAFEPDSRTRLLLQSNVSRNGYTNVKIFPYAIGDQVGNCTFTITSVPGWSSRFPNDIARSVAVETVNVPTTSLDELVRLGEIRISNATFIKIDAEGSEPLILHGMRGILTNTDPILWIEVNCGSLSAGGFTCDDIQRPLCEAGLSLYWAVFYRKGKLLPSIQLRPIRNLREERSLCTYENIVAFRSSKLGQARNILH